MNKQQEVTKTTRYCVQWDSHARHMCTVFCSLMEHQSLVDLAICCGPNTIHAHKCVLAANSPYFKEQLEKNDSVEQIIINGLDFTIVKSIIEFMYCGETNILNENLKYVIAAAKFFQMRGLQALVSDRNDVQCEANIIEIPPPLFISKKPKYTNALRQFNPPAPNSYNIYRNPLPNGDPCMYRKVKRKTIRSEADKACAKEAAASRLALEVLQKELASTPQINSFIIEESCTETTVENFIPHTEETIFENLNNMPTIPIQVVNFSDISTAPVLTTTDVQSSQEGKVNYTDPFVCLTPTAASKPADEVSDKIKTILGSEINGNVEIMFRTNDGNFVGVTDDLIQNLSGVGTLQYQIIDENGQLGEVREIQIQGGVKGMPEHSLKQEESSDFVSHNSTTAMPMDVLSTSTANSTTSSGAIDKSADFSLESTIIDLSKDDPSSCVISSAYDMSFEQSTASSFSQDSALFSGDGGSKQSSFDIHGQSGVYDDGCADVEVDTECTEGIIKKQKLGECVTSEELNMSAPIDVLPFKEIFETNSVLCGSDLEDGSLKFDKPRKIMPIRQKKK